MTRIIRIYYQIYSTLCLNFLLGVVGTELKWYSKIFADNDNGWIDLRSSNYSSLNVKSDVLSSVYLSFAKRNLTFDFPFYGEKIKAVKVTTQGFISMMGEDYQQVAEAHYISPLMANFSPTNLDPTQDVRIHQDDNMFIAQWSTMVLAEEEQPSTNYFTFQAQLHRDGTIVFIYKEIPVKVGEIANVTHPVVVGISGAYRFTKNGKPGYEAFDMMNIDKKKIASNTSYTFKPLPSCLGERTCRKCRDLSEHCRWCPTLQKCSTGKDSLKSAWDSNSCHLLSQSECDEDLPTLRPIKTEPPANNTTEQTEMAELPQVEDTENNSTKSPKHEGNRNDMLVIKALLISTGIIVLLLVVATILVRHYCGWRSTTFISHAKLENKGCSCNEYEEGNHNLIKLED